MRKQSQRQRAEERGCVVLLLLLQPVLLLGVRGLWMWHQWPFQTLPRVQRKGKGRQRLLRMWQRKRLRRRERRHQKLGVTVMNRRRRDGSELQRVGWGCRRQKCLVWWCLRIWRAASALPWSAQMVRAPPSESFWMLKVITLQRQWITPCGRPTAHTSRWDPLPVLGLSFNFFVKQFELIPFCLAEMISDWFDLPCQMWQVDNKQGVTVPWQDSPEVAWGHAKSIAGWGLLGLPELHAGCLSSCWFC